MIELNSSPGDRLIHFRALFVALQFQHGHHTRVMLIYKDKQIPYNPSAGLQIGVEMMNSDGLFNTFNHPQIERSEYTKRLDIQKED
ncbi:hypothetical protein JTB14_004938 [Gonioctena quinquepunctata]|nr:hypothetical protein JTB14_004938 [Gonioctena quinquepunctata]